MIQRQQTLWLLLSAVCGFLSFGLPFYSGTEDVDNQTKKIFLTADRTFPLFVVTGLVIVLSIVIIFLYKNRKLQFRSCLGGIALSLLLLFLYYNRMQSISGTLSLSCLITFAIPVGFIMAALRIRKDQRLVKSLDRLR